MSHRVGVFGGTFDPIHLGHLAAADDARADLGLDHVLFVPNDKPPHKGGSTAASASDRVEMVKRAVADNDVFSLSTIEVERGGLSFTLDTLRELRETLHPDTRLTFLTGRDALSQLHTWHEPDAILREFEVALIDRPLASALDWVTVERRFPGLAARVRTVEVPRLEISSADIRRRVSDGLPFRYYLPESVFEFVAERQLYGYQEPRPD